jgi:subtilisin family serine protease
MRDWNARGLFVYNRLQAAANSSQAGIRSFLRSRGASHRPFWVLNSLLVTGDKALLEQLQARRDVEAIVAQTTFEIPDPAPGQLQAAIDAIEWNIDRINAPQVWNTFGDRGEGIVVANVDTGVQFDHAALVAQYRGNLGGGSFDHNFNWFDPSLVCGNPSVAPCDNNGHGTHTMGTMVGDDGDPGANQIGVAPHARWIAAKGCESNFCSDSALLLSAQWILAPCPLGVAPGDPSCDPNRRPNIVNNSWGGGGGNPWYQASVDAWVASGIFPAFSNGNSGPGCGSSGSPGDYVNTYAAGAFDIGNNIAGFSSRGPSAFGGEIKPNIAAPGVDVRSSVPGGYASFSGTSMASPHVAGTVALIWSAAPALIGDIDGTRALLDQTAIDTDDQQCGGTAADNNVWGEGRLDAFAAVDQAPRGPTGTLQGVVTDASNGNPLPGAAISAVGPSNRFTTTDASGFYSIIAPIGTYDVTASTFGYVSQTATGIEVTEGATTNQDFQLMAAPSHMVSGMVLDTENAPIANARVTILGTPIPPAITDANGFYSFPSVPEGTYDVTASAGGCNDPQTQALMVDGDEALDFFLPQRTDAFGYFCRIETPAYMEGDTPLGLGGDDNATQVDLPFSFDFYGQTYNTAYVATNGFINFLGFDATFFNNPIPDGNSPNAAIYPYWDDMFVDGEASVFTASFGSAPDRQFLIEWRNVAYFADFSRRVDFEIVLHENGQILTQYRNIDADGREQGDSATIGIENEDGSIALQYSFNTPSVGSPEFAVSYQLPPSGFVQGYVTDANNGMPLAGASVQALQGGNPVRSASTDADGFYRMLLAVGTYEVQASLTDYVTESAVVDIFENQTIMQDFSLRSAAAEVSPSSFEFLLPAGRTQSQTLNISNMGTADLEFTIGEIPVLSVAGSAAPLGTDTHTASADYQPQSVNSVFVGGPVLVFMDVFPWGRDSLQQVLNANGIPFDQVDSSQMSTIDMSGYEVVFIPSDQSAGFYANYNANFTRFEDYVLNGGLLWVGASAWGFNGGDFNGAQLPGGATVVGPVFEGLNNVLDPGHPTMQGVPNPFSGNYASHAAFANLPAGTNVIAQGQGTGQPTLIEYDFGAGRVLAFGQTMEFYLGFGDPGRILENGVPYAYAFEPVVDLPWLSEDPSVGTVPAGATQQVQVTVDTTGLAPGLYRARLLIRTNDPHNPSFQIPVTLIVPGYYQGVNTGGGVYTDMAGDTWAADQAYAAGSFGYIGSSSTQNTRKPIAGTDDDRLYQNFRQRMQEYRFDGLPNGVYAVDLRFAELSRTNPGRHLFDVIIEGNLVLPAHDIAAEVGSLAADDHVFYVVVTDGQLNIRFVARTGFGVPIINAIRVIHRPDL